MLYEWLSRQDSGRIRGKVKKHEGPNTMAAKGLFAFEGLRATVTGEYAYTLLWRPPPQRIAAILDGLDDRWGDSPSDALEDLKRLDDD